MCIRDRYTPTQIICVSFVIVIALGTFLLSLPVASKHRRLDVLCLLYTSAVHVAHDGIRIILVEGFQLAAGL